MSIVSTARADYNRPNIQRLGSHHKRARRVASDGELHMINQAIVNLNQAKQSTSEPEFMAKISEAFKIARNVWRGRGL